MAEPCLARTRTTRSGGSRILRLHAPYCEYQVRQFCGQCDSQNRSHLVPAVHQLSNQHQQRYSKSLKFENAKPVYFPPQQDRRWSFSGEFGSFSGWNGAVFHDIDGSVGGVRDSYIVIDNGIADDPEHCQIKPDWNAAVCKGDMGRLIWRGASAAGAGGRGGPGGRWCGRRSCGGPAAPARALLSQPTGGPVAAGGPQRRCRSCRRRRSRGGPGGPAALLARLEVVAEPAVEEVPPRHRSFSAAMGGSLPSTGTPRYSPVPRSGRKAKRRP